MGMFGGLGDLGGLMKKVSEIQKNMKAMKEEMASLEIVGKDATGKVVVELSGDLQVKGFCIFLFIKSCHQIPPPSSISRRSSLLI